MFPKVSIVVPVYNLEDCIEKTLNSILSQSFSDYEIVIVDDHSSDGSVKVIELFFMEHPALCYVFLKHEKTRGVSAARNRGMNEASGEFIIFWDGDDLANTDFISTLYYKATSNKNYYDIVISGHRVIDDLKGIEKIFPIPLKIAEGKNSQQIACLRIMGRIKSHVCSSIYKRSFLENCSLEFYEGCAAGEDAEFAIKALVRSNLTGLSKKNDYIYMIHKNMGSIKNADTSYKRIERYSDNTKSHKRTTEYISLFVQDKELEFINDHLLLPQTIHKEMSLLAAQNNFIVFNEKIKNKKTRKILGDSIKTIIIKPEVFIRSLWLLLLPRFYFIYYSKRF